MSVSYGQLEIEVLGHASLRIETTDGTICYIDPWCEVLGDHAGDADLVFVTHDDYDHYDPSAIKILATDATTVVVYEAVNTSNFDLPIVEIAIDGKLTVDDVDICAVPAYNDPAGTHVDASGTPYHQRGEVIGLLLTFDDTTIYYASDTDLISEHQRIDAEIFVPPIGGTYTMNWEEAAAAARAIRPELVIPVHYDTFELIETDVSAFEAKVETAGIRVERD